MREISAAITGALLLGVLLFPDKAGEIAAKMVRGYRAEVARMATR